MRILVISDIHANLAALDRVLRDAGSFDKIWCLGDVIGYGPQPNECIARLREYDLLCIAGNHDWAALDKVNLNDFNPDARRAALWTRHQLTVSNIEWLDALPERVPPQMEKFTLVHGSPRLPIFEYVLTPAAARLNFDQLQTPFCFMGHTHVPLLFRLRDQEQKVKVERLEENSPLTLGPEKMMINPGSVGQPRDGDYRAAYAILDTASWTVDHHRISYDIEATQVKMEQAGLPLRLIVRLNYGW